MKSRLYVILFMVALAAIFGAAVSGLHIVSAGTVARNSELRRQKAYVDLFDLAPGQRLSASQIADLVARRIDAETTVTDPESGAEYRLLKAFADDGRQQLKALGFAFRGYGFWAPIEGVLAVTPDLSTTVGLVILEQKETPGLGGRIEEPIFTRQFADGILVAPPTTAGNYLRIATAPPSGDEQAARRHVDAISGATQTGMAMERILNDALASFGRAMAAAQ